MTSNQAAVLSQADRLIPSSLPGFRCEGHGDLSRKVLHCCLSMLLIVGASTGVAGQTLSSASLSFGNQAVGTASAAKNVTLTNKKKSAITITSIATNLADYVETNNCPISPQTLAPSASCTISVTFTPALTGTRKGTLTITDSGTQNVSLSGTGIIDVSATPSSLAFGNEILGKKSGSGTVTVTNNEPTTLTISSIATNSSDYSITADTCPLSPATMAAKASCKITLVFTPSVLGADNATLTISDNANNSPTVSLTGTGIPPVGVSPAALVFSPQPLGTTSAAQTVTLVNNQSTALTIKSVTSSLADFGLSSTCPISPNKLAAGASCTVNVTFSPAATGTRTGTLSFVDNASNSPQSVSLSGTGAPASLVSIAVNPGSASIPAGNTQQFTATGTYTDGSTQNLTTAVSWTSSASGVASINASGLASSTAAGQTTITAASGSINGSATLTVGPPALVSIAVTPANPTFALGTSQPLHAIGTYTDGSTLDITTGVTWNTANTSIATVTSQGVAASVSVGSTSVTATSGSIVGATSLTVSPAVLVSIAVTPAISAIPFGTSQQFTATGTFSDGSVQNLTTTVQWSSDTPTTSTISNSVGSQGVASSTGEGTATISATSGAVTGSTVLTVTAAALASIAVTPTNPTIGLETTQAFTATGTYTDGSTQDLTAIVQWSSGTPTTATISNSAGSQGFASGLAGGTATITATSGSVQGATTLTVTTAALASIAVTPTNPTIAPGTTQAFTATGTYTDGSTQDLTQTGHWSSTNGTAATISDTPGTQGVASALATGATTITLGVGSVSGTAALTVSSASLVTLTVNPQGATIPLATTEQYTATGTYTDGSTQNVTTSVQWSSSSATVAVISNGVGSQGLATSAGTGTTAISATLGTQTASTTLTVAPPTIVSLTVNPASATIPLGTGQQFQAIATYTDGSTQDVTSSVTWSSNTPSVAVIGSGGAASSVGVGIAGITASSGGVTGSATLTVGPPTLVSLGIAPAGDSIQAGLTLQFTATGSFTDNSTQNLTDSVTWGSSNTTVVTVSAVGLATALNAGLATVSATYGGVTGTTQLTVTSPILSRVPRRVCVVENETSTSSSCTLAASIASGDGLVVFITSVNGLTLSPDALQDSAGNTYTLLAGPVSGGYGALYMGYSLLTTALVAGNSITLDVSGADSWGLSIYDIGPVRSSSAHVGVTFQNADVGLPGINNPATGVPGWWTGQTSPTTGTSDMCVAALGVGHGQPTGVPVPITYFTADNNFITLDVAQFYAQSDPNYSQGGTLLTMYEEVPASAAVQSHVITTYTANTAPSLLYCFGESPGPVTNVPLFTGNYCTGTSGCTINNVVAGHMLIISLHSANNLPPNPITVSDSQYETVTFDQINGSVGLGTWHIAPVANPGTHTVSVNDPADANALVDIVEIAGQASGNPVEAIAQNTFNSSTLASVTLTTLTGNDLLYGWGRSGDGSDEGQGFTAVLVAPTAEYAVAPASGPQTVSLLPRGSSPWSDTGIQAMAIRAAGTSQPPPNAPWFTGNYCVGASSCTINNVTAGDMLVVSSLWGALSNTPAISDSQTENIVVDRGKDTDGTLSLSTWHIASVTNAGSHTISVSPAYNVIVTEYAGQSSSDPIDAVTGTNGSGGGLVSTSVQTSTGNDLIYSFCAADDGSGWGDGFAAITTSPTAEYRMAASIPGIETATCPSDNSSAGWIIQELAIKQ